MPIRFCMPPPQDSIQVERASQRPDEMCVSAALARLASDTENGSPSIHWTAVESSALAAALMSSLASSWARFASKRYASARLISKIPSIHDGTFTELAHERICLVESAVSLVEASQARERNPVQCCRLRRLHRPETVCASREPMPSILSRLSEHADSHPGPTDVVGNHQEREINLRALISVGIVFPLGSAEESERPLEKLLHELHSLRVVELEALELDFSDVPSAQVLRGSRDTGVMVAIGESLVARADNEAGT
jgi:hypothetical protein